MSRSAILFILALGCSDPPSVPVVEFDASRDVVDAGVADAESLPRDASSSPFDAGDDLGVDSPSDTAPMAPTSLTQWVTGNPADAVVDAATGLILMGGGREPDEAFEWWSAEIAGGDIVVLRVSGSDGYNDYLYSDIGGFDSVTTLKVDTRDLADDPYVAWQIDHAEGVFLAGGNQWDYLSLWGGTALQNALRRVTARGGMLGGTSAGLAVLGQRAFSAENGTVYSEEALSDPFNEFMRFEDDFLMLEPLSATVTDSHFRERDRMGRLVSFVARMWTDGVDAPLGIGVDERTALLIAETRRVVGTGGVYEVTAAGAPERCEPGQPLDWSDITVTRTTATEESTYTVGVTAGEFDMDPYETP